MDENEVSGRSPLAQVAQVSIAPQAEQAPSVTKQAVAATAQPSEYEKAIAEYRRQQQQLIERQKELIDSLNTRIQPSDYLSAMAQGFGDPRNLSFASGIAGATGNVSAIQAAEQKRAQDLAKMKLELGMQELGMRKENIELAKTQQLSSALTGLLSGRASLESAAAAGITGEQASLVANMPAEYKGMIIAQLQTGDVKGAIQELQKYMLEQTKEPEKIKELRYYMSQLQSPAARSIAQQLAANNYFLGNPADRSKAILDIRKSIDQGIIPANEGNILIQGLTSIGGDQAAPAATGADGVYRMTKPTEQEALAAARNADAAGIPVSVGVQPGGSSVTATESIAGFTPEQLAGLSPEQIRNIKAKKLEADIDVNKNIRTQAGQAAEKRVVSSEESADSAFSKINSMNRILNLSPDAPQGALQPLITNVQNLISSFGYEIKDLNNAQVVNSTINSILANFMKELGARGLTDSDIRIIGDSLPRLNTSKAARDEVAKILIKSYNKDLEKFRIVRANEARVNPDVARTRETPLFYIQWLESEGLATDLKRRYQNADELGKKNLINSFNKKFGMGTAEDILKINR